MQSDTGTSIALGMLAQVCFGVGLSLVGGAIAKERLGLAEEIFRTGLVLSFAGVTAVALALTVWGSGAADLSILKSDSWTWFVVGSIVAIVGGEVFYLAGMSAKNLTTVSYTALACPAVAFAIDWWRGKAELAVKDVVAFVLMGAGFLLLVYGPTNKIGGD